VVFNYILLLIPLNKRPIVSHIDEYFPDKNFLYYPYFFLYKRFRSCNTYKQVIFFF